jgi:hypothetical protein
MEETKNKIKEFRKWLVYRIRIAEEMKLLSLSERKVTLQRFDEIFTEGTKKKYGVWK